jgi:crotonobetainyl-CoA:carnitine CoA-transferase CaiB-like acyl-CoA transferase
LPLTFRPGPVLSVGEAVDAMQRAHDGEWLQEMERVRLAPNPILVDGERMPLRILPPRFGQHTTEVLEELGFDGPAIAEFYRAEVVR